MVQKQQLYKTPGVDTRPGGQRSYASECHLGDYDLSHIPQITMEERYLLADATKEGTPEFNQAIAEMNKVREGILRNRLKGNEPE